MKKKSNKVGGGLGGMVAAMMPGAEIDKKGRVLVNIATSRETLIFNIGGVNFETYRYDLRKTSNTKNLYSVSGFYLSAYIATTSTVQKSGFAAMHGPHCLVRCSN